ncbi:hypothetical protein TPB0596_29660 [Tsukamurella pulmonis]|nr:hypothetical protein TPB0596_29660 [Tsukamurella pulmonis]
MNGTVDPSSSNWTAAATWFSPTESSSAMRADTDFTGALEFTRPPYRRAPTRSAITGSVAPHTITAS